MLDGLFVHSLRIVIKIEVVVKHDVVRIRPEQKQPGGYNAADLSKASTAGRQATAAQLRTGVRTNADAFTAFVLLDEISGGMGPFT